MGLFVKPHPKDQRGAANGVVTALRPNRFLIRPIMIFDAKQETAKIDDHHGVSAIACLS
jgi:hypothetical protein